MNRIRPDARRLPRPCRGGRYPKSSVDPPAGTSIARWAATVLTVTVMGLGAAQPAYTADEPALSLEHAEAWPGQEISVTLDGFVTCEELKGSAYLMLGNKTLAKQIEIGNEPVTVKVTIPSDERLGKQLIVGSCASDYNTPMPGGRVLIVLIAPPVASIVVEPDSVQAGKTAHLTATTLAPDCADQAVDIRLNNRTVPADQTVLRRTEYGQTGAQFTTMTATISVPDLAAGSYRATVSCGGVQQPPVATVQVLAAVVPPPSATGTASPRPQPTRTRTLRPPSPRSTETPPQTQPQPSSSSAHGGPVTDAAHTITVPESVGVAIVVAGLIIAHLVQRARRRADDEAQDHRDGHTRTPGRVRIVAHAGPRRAPRIKALSSPPAHTLAVRAYPEAGHHVIKGVDQ
jgi:hypothetical protein